MRTLILYIFILSYGYTLAQNDSSKINKNQIKLSPIRLMSVDRGIELNYERQIHKNFSMQITGRCITDIFKDTPQRSYTNLTGFAFYFEPKFYKPLDKQTKAFFSASIGYLQCKFENVDEFLNIHADSINKQDYDFVDTVNIDRRAFDININCGIQRYYKNFVFEFSAGVGLRYREVSLSNKLYEDAKIWHGLHDFFISSHDDGNFFVPNIPLRFKIGYCF